MKLELSTVARIILLLGLLVAVLYGYVLNLVNITNYEVMEATPVVLLQWIGILVAPLV
jgi:uncharacterized protein with PQ loop repeat